MVKVITYATKSDGTMPQLLKSFEIFSGSKEEHELVVLGFNTEWKGFGHRVHQVKEYADQCNSDELLLCIDAYDVVLTGNLDNLEFMFNRIVDENNINVDTTVIISEEKFSFTEALWAKYFTFGTINNKHLTAGVYMGKASAVSRLLNKVCENPQSQTRYFDDQVAFNQVGNADLNLFYFDSDWDLFATFNGHACRKDVLAFNNDGTMFYKNKPIYVLHMPGNPKMTADVLQSLGYDVSDYTYRESYMGQLILHGFRSYPNVRILFYSGMLMMMVFFIFLIYFCFRTRTRNPIIGNNDR